MEWRVDHAPAYSVLKVKLNPNEKIVTEPGAMVTTIGDIKVQTKMEGGVFKALKRKFLGSESAFMNTYIAGPNGGEVWLAPSVPGDIKYVELKNQSISVQDMAYLAHHGDVTVDVAFRGFFAFFLVMVNHFPFSDSSEHQISQYSCSRILDLRITILA